MLLSDGNRLCCIAKTDESASLLIPGCPQNQVKYLTFTFIVNGTNSVDAGWFLDVCFLRMHKLCK